MGTLSNTATGPVTRPDVLTRNTPGTMAPPRSHTVQKFRETTCRSNACPQQRTAWPGTPAYGSTEWQASSKKRVRLLPVDMRNSKQWLNQTDSHLLNRECATKGGHYHYEHESTKPLDEMSFLATSAAHSPDPRPAHLAKVIANAQEQPVRRTKHAELLASNAGISIDSAIQHMTQQRAGKRGVGHRYQQNQLAALMIDPGCEVGRDYHKEHAEGKYRHAYSELVGADHISKDSALTRKYSAAYVCTSPEGLQDPRVDLRKLQIRQTANRKVAPELMPSDEQGRMNVSMADSALYKKYGSGFIVEEQKAIQRMKKAQRHQRGYSKSRTPAPLVRTSLFN